MKNGDEYISIKAMMFQILYRWRSILLVSVLMCILAGGYSIIYNIVDRTEQQNNNLDKELEELKELEIKSPVKYTTIGFGAGIVLMIFLYSTAYIFSNKISEERELKERYGYCFLGSIPRVKKKKHLSSIDLFLEKIEGDTEQITESEAYKIIAVNITNLAKAGGTFLVTGTLNITQLFGFTEMLLPQLNENITIITGENMNVCANTLEILAECDAVILIEERNKSLRTKVQKEHESIVTLGKTVLGYVMY